MTGIKSTVFAMILLAGIGGRIEAVNAGNNAEVATLAGGCFWCLEAVFEELEGVHKVESGFAGGNFKASYEEADVGTQYRSAIFYHDDGQKALAGKAIVTLTEEKIWPNKVVTEIAPFDKFFKAESHHQDYYRNNKSQGYCQVVINPKLDKFRKQFAARLKD